MSLSKEYSIDTIDVSANGTVFVRQVERVMQDGIAVSQSYNRWSLIPGQDLTGQPENVQSIATAAWTSEVISAYHASVDNAQLPSE